MTTTDFVDESGNTRLRGQLKPPPGGAQTLAQVLATGDDAGAAGIAHLGPSTLAALVPGTGVGFTAAAAGAGDPEQLAINGAAAGATGYSGAVTMEGAALPGGPGFVTVGAGSDGSVDPAVGGAAQISAGSGAPGDGGVLMQPSAAHGGDGSVVVSGEKLAFFNGVAVAKPTGVAVTAAAIHAALVALGLIDP